MGGRECTHRGGRGGRGVGGFILGEDARRKRAHGGGARDTPQGRAGGAPLREGDGVPRSARVARGARERLAIPHIS